MSYLCGMTIVNCCMKLVCALHSGTIHCRLVSLVETFPVLADYCQKPP